MKLFLFERVVNASDNYHCEGGVVIVAEDMTLAKQMIANALDYRGDSKNKEFYKKVWKSSEDWGWSGNYPNDYEALEISEQEWEVAHVFELSGEYEPQIFIMPDAGCC